MVDGHDAARGARVAALRKGRAMTQDALAGAAGVSAQTVKRAEAGRPMQAETVQAFCAALGAVPTDILGPAVPSTAPTPPASDPVQAASRDVRSRARPAACWVVAVLAFAVALGVENGAWGIAGQTVLDFRVAQAVAVAALAAGILALTVPGMLRQRRPGWAVAACAFAVLAAGLEPSVLLVRDYRVARVGVGRIHEALVIGDAVVRSTLADVRERTDQVGSVAHVLGAEGQSATAPTVAWSIALWSADRPTEGMLADIREPDIALGTAQIGRCRNALHRPGRGSFAACREAYVRLVRHGYEALGEAFLGGPLLDLTGFDDIDRRFEALAPARALG